MTGNRTLDMAIIGLMTLATASVLSLFVYTEILYTKPLPDEKAEKQKLFEQAKAQKINQEAIKLDKLTINLPTERSRLHYLDLESYLIPFKADTRDLVEKKKSIIYDAIIDAAMTMEAEELNSVTGKMLFESRIKNKINDILGGKKIKDIQFTVFVVQ
ncbi:MAG: hypothetical protein Fur0010_02620 [Bdellovibrio sp.]